MDHPRSNLLLADLVLIDQNLQNRILHLLAHDASDQLHPFRRPVFDNVQPFPLEVKARDHLLARLDRGVADFPSIHNLSNR